MYGISFIRSKWMLVYVFLSLSYLSMTIIFYFMWCLHGISCISSFPLSWFFSVCFVVMNRGNHGGNGGNPILWWRIVHTLISSIRATILVYNSFLEFLLAPTISNWADLSLQLHWLSSMAFFLVHLNTICCPTWLRWKSRGFATLFLLRYVPVSYISTMLTISSLIYVSVSLSRTPHAHISSVRSSCHYLRARIILAPTSLIWELFGINSSISNRSRGHQEQECTMHFLIGLNLSYTLYGSFTLYVQCVFIGFARGMTMQYWWNCHSWNCHSCTSSFIELAT